MDMQNLIHMANKIGSFFESVPDHEEALRGITGHIQSFWAPRMRSQLLAHVDSTNGEGLTPIVLEAILANRNSLLPRGEFK